MDRKAINFLIIKIPPRFAISTEVLTKPFGRTERRNLTPFDSLQDQISRFRLDKGDRDSTRNDTK